MNIVINLHVYQFLHSWQIFKLTSRASSYIALPIQKTKFSSNKQYFFFYYCLFAMEWADYFSILIQDLLLMAF